MKTLLIQLSDIHLLENHKVNYGDLNVKNFFGFLSSKDYAQFNEILIAFTGDLTQHGYLSELKNFQNLVDNISKTIKENFGKETRILIVAGNHDINLTNSKTDYDKLINLEKNNFTEIDKEIELEKENLNRFFSFSNSLMSVDNGKRLIQQINVNNIAFLLINSAPFSALDKKDKEHHHMPNSEIELIDNDEFNNSIGIALMHHRPDWFNSFSSEKLNSFFKKYINIVLYGHEHSERDLCDFTDEENLYYFNSGCLSIKKNKLIGTANIIIIDDSKNKIFCNCSSYNQHDNFPKLKGTKDLPVYQKNVVVYTAEHKKNNKITLDETTSFNLEDIFVMPFLMNLKDNDDDIDNFDNFVEHFYTNKKVFIYGRPNSGKTILLKYLANYISEKNNAIFISYDEISYNYEASIENAYFNCYGQRKKFNELSNFASVIFVDGIDEIDTIKKREEFIEFLNANFEFIVYTSSKKASEIGNDLFKEYSKLSVNGFSYKQRNEFIEKICGVYKISDDEEVSLIKNAISISFSACSMLDLTSPMYVLLCTDKIIKDKLYKVQNVSDAFTLIFQHDIESKIIEYGKRDNLEDYLNVLAEIAYSVTSNYDITEFDEDLIRNSITVCKDLYKNIKLSSDNFIEVFLKSGIIHKVSDNLFRFNHNSLLAFFASRKICILVKNDDTTALENLYNNIEIGLNGDILLFVLHELKETRILFRIKESLVNALSVYSEINLNTKNNPILRMVKEYGPETPSQAENKQEFIKRLDTSEKKEIKKIDSKETKALQKVEQSDEFLTKIQKAFKLIEILAKASAGFKTELIAEKRIDLMKTSVSSLLKVFYALFDISEKDANEFHEEFETFKTNRAAILKKQGISDKTIVKKLEEFNFENYIYDIMTTNLLNDLTYIAKVMTSKVSSPFIDQIFDKNNSMCYNLFKLVAYEEHGSMKSKFIDLVGSVFEDENETLGNKYLVKRIVRVFSITNTLDRSEISQLSDASNFKKQKLIINQNKNLRK